MEKSSVSGLPANTAAALAYVFPVLGGVIMLAMNSSNDYVRFHAMQSIVWSVTLFVGLIVFLIVPVIGWILLPFWILVMFVLWLVAIVKAWQGETFKLPVLGQYAEQFAKKA